MRVGGESLQSVKTKIAQLKGETVDMEVNRGRNRIVKLRAVIEQVYPSMFVIKPMAACEVDRFSYSYGDLLCGDIKIKNCLQKDIDASNQELMKLNMKK